MLPKLDICDEIGIWSFVTHNIDHISVLVRSPVMHDY